MSETSRISSKAPSVSAVRHRQSAKKSHSFYKRIVSNNVLVSKCGIEKVYSTVWPKVVIVISVYKFCQYFLSNYIHSPRIIKSSQLHLQLYSVTFSTFRSSLFKHNKIDYKAWHHARDLCLQSIQEIHRFYSRRKRRMILLPFFEAKPKSRALRCNLRDIQPEFSTLTLD